MPLGWEERTNNFGEAEVMHVDMSTRWSARGGQEGMPVRNTDEEVARRYLESNAGDDGDRWGASASADQGRSVLPPGFEDRTAASRDVASGGNLVSFAAQHFTWAQAQTQAQAQAQGSGTVEGGDAAAAALMRVACAAMEELSAHLRRAGGPHGLSPELLQRFSSGARDVVGLLGTAT